MVLRKAVNTREDPPHFQVTLHQDHGHDVEALVFCHLKSDFFGELEELVLVFRDVTSQAVCPPPPPPPSPFFCTHMHTTISIDPYTSA